jgi:nicotinate-nucleotide adenylyltransferase
MEFMRKAAGVPMRVGIFPGAFHPPTRAHLGIAKAALTCVDEVVFVMPQEFPHKEYGEVSRDQRLGLLAGAAEEEPRFSVAVSERGLFADMARECRAVYGAGPELWIICGRDAAERAANWDYGVPYAFANMMREFGLLVASRDGQYQPAGALARRIRPLSVEEDYTGISSTQVRERIRRGEEWEHLVPAGIVEAVKGLYRRAG